MRQLPPLSARSRNLVRFARHLGSETMDASFAGDFAFRDAGSRFSLLKSPGTAPGPDECWGLYARDARLVFRKLLGLRLAYDGLDPALAARLAPYNAIDWFRSHIHEHFADNGLEPMPPLLGGCTLWFATADVLCVRYRLENRGPAPLAVTLAFRSEAEAGAALAPAAGGFDLAIAQSAAQVAYTVRAELRGADGAVFAVAGTQADSAAQTAEIPPHGVFERRFAVRFACNDEAYPPWPDGLWSDAALAARIAEAEAAYAVLPTPPARFARYDDLQLKAAGTLRSLRYRDRDADGAPVMTIHAGKTGCGATWFWDTGCTLPGLGLLQEREAAAGALRLLCSGIRPDGEPPVTYENQEHRYQAYQMPLLAWGAGHFLAACPDRALLAGIYPALARYVRHWLTRFRGRWALVVHPPGCSCLDDAVRWHSRLPGTPPADRPWHAVDWGTMEPGSFACPDLNAFLVLELRTLASMAEALVRPHEAAAWREEAERLGAAVQELLDPATGTYQDRHTGSGAFTGMVHLGSAIPVYAGLAPPAVGERFCRAWLLNPEHFLTPMPFPVVDRAHFSFRSGGFLHAPPEYPGALVQHSYWRGRTWVHGALWCLGALCRHGFQAEADAIVGDILANVARGEGINECYDSLTGTGNGHPEFMWSAAAVLLLIDRAYTRPPVAALAAAPAVMPGA